MQKSVPQQHGPPHVGLPEGAPNWLVRVDPPEQLLVCLLDELLHDETELLVALVTNDLLPAVQLLCDFFAHVVLLHLREQPLELESPFSRLLFQYL